MKYLILIASFCCVSAFAQSVTTDVLISDDSDNQKVKTTTVNLEHPIRDNTTLNVEYINASGSDPSGTVKLDRLLLKVSTTLGETKLSVGGGALNIAGTVDSESASGSVWGIETPLSKTVIVGFNRSLSFAEDGASFARATLTRVYAEHKSKTVTAKLYHDRIDVDGVDGAAFISNNYSTGVYADYNADTYGVYGKYSYTRLSDENIRNYVDFKSYVTLFPEEGVSAHVKVKHHTNTKPSEDYFSPDRYTRALVGLSVRRAIAPNVIFTGHLDTGYQWVDGEKFPSWSAKVGMENRITSSLNWRAVYGIDQFQTDYKYRYLMLYLNYYF